MKFVVARLPVIVRAGTLALNVLMAITIARLFGAAASGEFFLAFVIANLMGMLGRLGAENYAIKSLPSLFHLTRIEAFWCELLSLRRLTLLGSVAAGMLLFAMGFVTLLLNGNLGFGLHLMLLAISVPFSCLSILESSALRSAERISLGALAETGLTQGLTIVALGTISSIHALGPLSISACYTVASVCTFITARRWTKKKIPRAMYVEDRARKYPSSDSMRSMLKMMGSSVLFFVLTSSPLYVLGFSSSPRELGYFNAATRISTLIALIPSLQVTYLVPRVARCIAENDLRSANRLLRRAVRQATLASCTAATAMVILAVPVLSIFGDDFAGALPILLVLVVGQAILSILGNVNPIMSIAGLEGTSVFFASSAILIGVLAMYFSAAISGATGVAAAYVLVMILYAVASSVSLVRLRGIRCHIS